jgi:hypothetical protein
MHGEPKRARGGDVQMVERAVVLQLLRDDHDERWPRPELQREVDDVVPGTFERALACLAREGVLHVEGRDVRASRSVRRLDELDLFAL